MCLSIPLWVCNGSVTPDQMTTFFNIQAWKLYWPSLTKYQPVSPYSDSVQGSANQNHSHFPFNQSLFVIIHDFPFLSRELIAYSFSNPQGDSFYRCKRVSAERDSDWSTCAGYPTVPFADIWPSSVLQKAENVFSLAHLIIQNFSIEVLAHVSLPFIILECIN